MTTQDLITQYANKYNIPPTIAINIAQRESNFNQSAIGQKGEIGMFQLMPATANSLNVDPTDLNQNIEGAMKLLAENYNRFGTWDKAIAAYNAGPGLVASDNVPTSTLQYVKAILGQPYKAFQSLFDSSNVDLSVGQDVSQTQASMIQTTNTTNSPIQDILWWVGAIGIGVVGYLLFKK
jgi:hypothetical protein